MREIHFFLSTINAAAIQGSWPLAHDKCLALIFRCLFIFLGVPIIHQESAPKIKFFTTWPKESFLKAAAKAESEVLIRAGWEKGVQE